MVEISIDECTRFTCYTVMLDGVVMGRFDTWDHNNAEGQAQELAGRLEAEMEDGE